jgi:hypothetical protein
MHGENRIKFVYVKSFKIWGKPPFQFWDEFGETNEKYYLVIVSEYVY